MTTFLLDVRHALRVLGRHRGVTASALCTLALAIGANTAIFTVVSAILLTPLPLPEPHELVRIEEQHASRRSNLTGATFSDLRERGRSFEGIAAYRLTTPGIVTGVAPEQVTAAEVSQDYFAVLGVAPALGRAFGPADLLAGAAPVVVLSDDIWRRSFGADPQIVGRRVPVNARPTDVVGVMPRGLYAPGSPHIWLPSPSSSPLLRNRRAHLFTVIARLRDDSSVGTATEELAAVSRQIRDDSAAADPNMTLVASPLHARLVQSVRPALLALWGAVGLLLVIGAANIANLLLMLASSRVREVSIRTALGAKRSRLVAQFVTESLVLGVLGGLAGTLLGVWGVPLLRAALPSTLPRAADVAPDGRVILFAVGLSFVTALVFGLIPALRASAEHAGDALRDRHGDGRTQSRLRGALVVIEVALAVLLLSGAGLLARSFASVLGVHVGFDPDRVVSFDLSLPAAKYGDATAHAAFLEGVVERIAPLPGVSTVGVTGALVMSGTPATTMEPEATPVRDALAADVVTASPGFFPALRIPLKQGRLFTPGDRRGAAPVMLINETAVKTFWPDGRNPIGRRITMKDWGAPYPAEVVGVVGDVHQAGPDLPVQPAAYYPVAQFPETLLRNSIVIRTTADPIGLVGAAREQVWALDPELPVASVRTMDQILTRAVSERRFNLTLLGAFSIAALVLAGIGIYGVVAFAIGQRTREIGVRIALGARPLDVARLTIAQGVVPVGVGLLLGLAGAVFGSRLLEGMLYRVSPSDPTTLTAVSVLVASIALVACAIPARRALRIDPANALRSE